MDKKLLDIFNDVEDYHWWFAGRRILLERLMKRRKNTRKKLDILDIGCGVGGMVKFLERYGHVKGIDNMQEAVDYCRGKGIKEVKKADAIKLPFPNKSFDVVTTLDVMEHIQKPEIAIKEAKRVLKDGGWLIITVPAMPAIWSRHDSLQGHYKRYIKSDLTCLAEAAGLSILDMGYFNFIFFLPIATIRVLSRIRKFNNLGDFDSKINFEMAKNKFINNFLKNIFAAEMGLGEKISYPVGVSLYAVMEKRGIKKLTN